MLNQEMASVIHYILGKIGEIKPYYNEIPEGFRLPAVYFPPPGISSRGDTLSSYALGYTWLIRFYHEDTPSAYNLGLPALEAIQGTRGLIPLIDETGADTGRCFRVNNPALHRTDGKIGLAQLELSWDSPRLYDERDYQKIAKVNWTIKKVRG